MVERGVPNRALADLGSIHNYFGGKRGRPPKGIRLMLRMYLPRVWFNLAGEAVEEQMNLAENRLANARG
jgi:hypothetical protein